MTAHSADPAFSLHALTLTLPDRDIDVDADLQQPIRHDNLGAFRGLCFAILLQFLVAFAGFGAWMVMRNLL